MIDILMATYNGEKFIQKQIESIINQTYKDWQLFIHDDGSTDNTLKILNNIEDKRIHVIADNTYFKNSTLNFIYLMKNFVKSDYFCFSDQDDVWLPNKLEILLTVVKNIEEENNYNIPICVGSDLIVVDEQLKIISESFILYRKLTYNPNFYTLLIENIFTGCSMIMNKAVLKYFKNENSNIDFKDIIQHDWFIALICAADGRIKYIKEPTIKYRQHGNNAVGAKSYSIKNMISINEWAYRILKIKRSILTQLINLKNIINNPALKEDIDMFLHTKGIKHKTYLIKKKIIYSSSIIKMIEKFIIY